MWGALKNAAVMGLSRVDEFTSSATQLLEQLDGAVEGSSGSENEGDGRNDDEEDGSDDLTAHNHYPLEDAHLIQHLKPVQVQSTKSRTKQSHASETEGAKQVSAESENVTDKSTRNDTQIHQSDKPSIRRVDSWDDMDEPKAASGNVKAVRNMVFKPKVTTPTKPAIDDFGVAKSDMASILEKKNSKMDEQRAEISALMEANALIKKEVVDVSKDLKRITKEKNSLEVSLKTANDAKSKIVEDLSNEIEGLKKHNGDILKDLALQKQNATKLEEALNAELILKAGLVADVQRLREVADAGSTASGLDKQLLEQHECDMATLADTNKQLMAKNAELLSASEIFQSDITAMRNNLAVAQSQLATANATNDKEKANHLAMKDAIDATVARLEQRLGSVEAERDALVAQLSRGAEELEALVCQRDEAAARAHSALAQLHEQQESHKEALSRFEVELRAAQQSQPSKPEPNMPAQATTSVSSKGVSDALVGGSANPSPSPTEVMREVHRMRGQLSAVKDMRVRATMCHPCLVLGGGESDGA